MGNRSKSKNENVGLVIKQLRNNAKLTQVELSKILNKCDSTVRMWELGKSEPDNETLIKIAEYFNVTVDYLLGINEEDERIRAIGGFELPEELFPIPLVGQVVCGKPIESPENLEGYVYINFKHPEEYFALRVQGDSMINIGINPKSLLIVHRQNYAEDGDIVVACVDGESTTKRYKKQGDIILLMPENQNYSPIIVTDKNKFNIFGKVVQVRTDY